MAGPVPKYSEKRAAFYERAERFTPFVGTRSGTGVYIMRTRDKDVGRTLFMKEGRGEMLVLARAAKVLTALLGEDAVEGKTFIDVGANIGTETVPALLDHGFARVVALEPEDDNFLTLRANTVLNGIDDRVVALRMAASNETGVSELVVNLEKGGKHWIATDEIRKSHPRATSDTVQVETVTLDDLASDGVFDPDSAGLLWIDAQGHEGHIVDGATEVTLRGVPIVLEWDPRSLDKIGDRGKIQEIAGRCYTHFAAMRADPSADGPRFWLRSVGELDEYADRFLDPSERTNFTDIMLLRLSEGDLPEKDEAGRIDISPIMKVQIRGGGPQDLDLDELEPGEREHEERRRAFRDRQRAQKAKDQRAQEKAERAASGHEEPDADQPR